MTEAHTPITRISLQHAGFDANRDVSANISLGMLKQFNLTFDYATQRIILELNHRFGERDVFDRAGLRLKREGGAWSVTAIHPGTPAAQAGIKPGDIISRIDGETPETLDVGVPGTGRRVILILRELL